MRQRVAFARTVIQQRSVMLLDEPFGALDSFTRTEMQQWLLDVWEVVTSRGTSHARQEVALPRPHHMSRPRQNPYRQAHAAETVRALALDETWPMKRILG